jgi:broad specificity phosphatase PhoE
LRQTAENLRGMQVDTIFSSSLTRAKESAEIINSVLTTDIELMDGLRERNYGVLGGLTKTEALEKYPEVVALHKDPQNTDPGGESWQDFTNRVLNSFLYITRQSHNTVVILGHGGSIKVILRHLNLPIPATIGDGEIIPVDI